MRNYISELRQAGISYRELARRTGIPHQRLSEYAKGERKLESGTEAYNRIRNAHRNVSYQAAREAGLRPGAARESRREFYSPTPEARPKSTVRTVKSPREATVWQLKLIGEFLVHSRYRTVQEGFSLARKTKEEEKAITECVNYVRAQLGTSDVILLRIISLKWLHYVVKPESSA